MDDETLGLGLRRLGVTVVVADAHARLAYPPGVAALVPAPAAVKIPRARTR